MSGSHHHIRPKTPQELRTAALETVLIERGLASTDAIDAVVAKFQNEIGPRNGAQMVARAWVDPAYRKRLLADGAAAAAEFGYGGMSPAPAGAAGHAARALEVVADVRRSLELNIHPGLGLEAMFHRLHQAR